MRRISASIAVFGLLICAPAEALPLVSHLQVTEPASLVENVKVVCDEQGRCFRPPTRRPVATWVYGDNNFYGPYAGPGYYGNPRYRYNWWPFWW
jgi:hypothetical protein